MTPRHWARCRARCRTLARDLLREHRLSPTDRARVLGNIAEALWDSADSSLQGIERRHPDAMRTPRFSSMNLDDARRAYRKRTPVVCVCGRTGTLVYVEARSMPVWGAGIAHAGDPPTCEWMTVSGVPK